MSQAAGGRMYHASQFRRPGDFPYFNHPNSSQHYNPHRSVQVYSITRYSAQNRGRGGRGGSYGSQRGRPFNNFYRPRNGYLDSDLEWDNYDIGANKSSRGRRNRQNGRDAYYRIGSSFSSSDSELEWDDYDLRSKKEAEAAGSGSLEIYVTEEFVPLISSTDSGSLSRGHIPLGAIQVRKLPQGNGDPGILLKGDDLGMGRELLLLTSEVNNNRKDPSTGGTGSIDETLVRIQDFLVQSGLDATTKTHEILKRRSSDSSQKTDKSPESDAPAESLSSESDALLEEDYEPNLQDKLADSDLYALLPPDLDSPDSLLSRSLADLTDQTLYEEYGLETRRRDDKDGETEEDKDKQDAKEKRKAVAKAKRRKRDKRMESDSSLGEIDDSRKKRLAPNFFVAIQVNNPEVLQSLRNVQQSVLEGDEKLKDAMVPIATLHLTVMVMHLSSEEEILKAKAALRDCQEILGPKFSQETLNIEFHGLGHFNNQVMFAKIKDSGNTVQALYEIADIVEKQYEKYGITSTGERGFKPHLTVMKLSRAPSLRKKGVRRIKSELYKVHSNKSFGSQVMTGLQLCSINKTKGTDGYFFKASELFFADYGMRSLLHMDKIIEDPSLSERKSEDRDIDKKQTENKEEDYNSTHLQSTKDKVNFDTEENGRTGKRIIESTNREDGKLEGNRDQENG